MDQLLQTSSTNFKTEMNLRQEITFFLQNKAHNVRINDFTPQTTLNDYLRNTLNLRGTKKMCRVGACGVCIVAVTITHPVTNEAVTITVNSCLVSLFSCHNWRITTVEGVSTKNPDEPDSPIYHQAQNALVTFNGTQCGFCSSGMIMSMYALLEQNPNITMSEIETSFGGNICRCTGYRPILAAFKTLASDADRKLIGNYPDIEDTASCKLNNGKCKKECATPCSRRNENTAFRLNYGYGLWYKVYALSDIIQLFQLYPDSTYMLVGGNTARGIFSNPADKDLYIDVTSVQELRSYTVTSDTLVLGGNMTLTEVITVFNTVGAENEGFSYLTKMSNLIDMVASDPVRNIGTVAGNLMMKHENGFSSDVFVIFEAVGATVTIVDTSLAETTVSTADFLSEDMDRKIILRINLNALDNSYRFENYKIMQRAQNSTALLTAGFLFRFDDSQSIVSARIVYGRINSAFIHATNTENYLIGKSIFENDTLQEAFGILNDELDPNIVQPGPSPAFRKQLAISLLYKFVLSIASDDQINARNRSGGEKLTRAISSGTQDYETNESLYPLTQAIPKIEAYAQVSGRAQYIPDMPDTPGQLYGALVLAKARPYSVITSIDTSDALNLIGAVAYYDQRDVPGRNLITASLYVEEELFCNGIVKFYNQPVGIIVAESQEIAEKAAELVDITYTEGQTTPLFTVQAVLNNNDTSRITTGNVTERTRTGDDVQYVIQGSYQSGAQYHFHMETQCCTIIPVEDGLDVYPATQWMDLIQSSISDVLNMKANKINIGVRRLGGAFGAKISRNGLFTCAAALAAYKLQRPVKLWAPFSTNVNVVGKRCPLTANYEAGVNSQGVIQYLTVTYYSDYGWAGGNENMLEGITDLIKSGYVVDTFQINPNSVRTDVHTNTWCRAPGSTEGLGVIEAIMEHISYATNLDPVQVRFANLDQNAYPLLNTFFNQHLEWANITSRKAEIETFNRENRWRKKGLTVVPMAYPYYPFGNYTVIISIYQADGTVAIAHGGIEMGQGINTKVVQVCAYALGIEVDQISVKPSNNLISPNVLPSGGSVTSESVCFAILQAAAILNERIAPIREQMDNPTWPELIRKCYENDINLSATYKFSTNEVKTYLIYNVCAAEVEVDILTGTYNITRVDILEDTGESMSPLIDIGQVEGAFIMGQGLWTMEETVFGEDGQILTNTTGSYKTPGANDIPIDFRVRFPKDNRNPAGVLNSKATAEPPLCVSCCVPLAIRNAVASARLETGSDEPWYNLEGPATVENTYLNSLHNYTQYTL